MATFKLKRLPQPTLRMKALPRFPARMQGGDGVAVTQSGGVFTFSLDPGFTPSFTDALPFAAGDIFYASGAASATRLAAAAAGQALLSGATPAWGKVGLTTHVAGVLPAANGGTGIANAGTITLGGALVTAGALTTSGPFPLTLTATGATNVTLPTSGTLATLAGSETLSNKDLASPTISGTATITAAATVSGSWTFSNTPTSLSTAAGAAAGPFYSSYRNSTGAADNLIGGYQHFGNNSTPTFFQYARSQARIKDATAGSEDGEWSAWTAVAGTLAERFTVGQGARIGAPAGGDPGSGSLNVAGSLLVNNVAVPTISSVSALTNKTYNGLTVTSSTGTLTIASAKTATVSNTLTFSGTDGSSVAFGTGGTVAYVGASSRIGLSANATLYVRTAPATITMTIASPAVASWTSHGLSANDPVVFNTTGALPTGVTAGTIYYVISAGLTANAFEFSTSLGGAAVNTSGSQSGTHSAQTGNDSNDGSAATRASALLTPQGAANLISASYDLRGQYQVIAQMADGAYTTSGWVIQQIGPFTGGNPRGTTFPSSGVAPVIFRGNMSTPASVVLTGTGGGAVLADAGAYFAIEGVKIISAGGNDLRTGTCASILYGNCILGASAGAKTSAGHSSTIEAYSPYWIDGNSPYIHECFLNGSFYNAGVTETQLSDIAVTAYARSYDSGSSLLITGSPFAANGHTFTGAKFAIDNGASVYTGTGGNLSYFPGSTAGTTGWGSYDGFAANLTAYSGFTVKSTVSSAASGPTLSLFRADPAPADNNLIGALAIYGYNATPSLALYANIQGKILGKTAGAENGQVSLQTRVSGTTADRLIIANGAYMTGATSGDMGAGTFNAQSFYINGVAPTGTLGLVRADNPTLTTGATVSSTTAGAGAGPTLSIYRNITSAANNLIGTLALFTNNASAGVKQFAALQGKVLTATAGAEDGQASIQTIVAGTFADRLIVANGAYMTGAGGGDKGAGTINASAVYDDGVQLGLSKVLTITRDLTSATGSVAYTGVGFKPTRLSASGGVGGNANYIMLAGFCDSALNQGTTGLELGTSKFGNTTAFIRSHTNSFADMQTGTVTSLDSDGFTISWAKTGSPTGTATYYVLCAT